MSERQRERRPARWAGRRSPFGSVGAAAGPDESVSVTAFDRDERGEDRRREARVVKLDREVFAARARRLLPCGAEFGLAREDAKIGSLVVLLLGPRNLGLDVERKRLDRAREIAVVALGEGADGRHDKSPCLNSGRAHRGLDGDQEAEGRSPRTACGRSAAEDGGRETFLFREECACAGEESRWTAVAGR